MGKTGLATGTAVKIGQVIPSADKHVLSTTVCRVPGQDIIGNETDTALVLVKREAQLWWGHARQD